MDSCTRLGGQYPGGHGDGHVLVKLSCAVLKLRAYDAVNCHLARDRPEALNMCCTLQGGGCEREGAPRHPCGWPCSGGTDRIVQSGAR